MPTKCFWLTDTERENVYLRRYVANSECTNQQGYHDARTFIGEQPLQYTVAEDGWRTIALRKMVDRADPRWPSACVCSYVFADTDPWQVSGEQIYVDTDGADHVLTDHAKRPVGAMWDAWWAPDVWRSKEDNRCIVVICPDGKEWMIDAPTSAGGRWLRTGTPPTITVNPSIDTGTYHGHLVNGEFAP